jgi:hypothetical protein
MANSTDSDLFSWILSGLIVVIATVAVILGSTDGARSAPSDPASKHAAMPQSDSALAIHAKT